MTAPRLVQPISVSLAMASLREVVDDLEAAEERVRQLREERNRLIADARTNGVSVTRLAAVVRLRRERVHLIIQENREADV